MKYCTQISNHFFLILNIYRTGSKQAVKFGILKKNGFSFANRTISNIHENRFDIWVQCSNTRLLIRHTTILLFFFNLHYRGFQTLKTVYIFEKYTSRKKSELFWNPLGMEFYVIFLTRSGISNIFNESRRLELNIFFYFMRR